MEELTVEKIREKMQAREVQEYVFEDLNTYCKAKERLLEENNRDNMIDLKMAFMHLHTALKMQKSLHIISEQDLSEWTAFFKKLDWLYDKEEG